MSALAALIVNYDSAGFALACVRSLQREWQLAGELRGALEIAVVDNASPNDAPEALAELQAAGARLVRASENLGYARGMQLALEACRPSDAVLVLNPDVVFLPGALARLRATLAAERDAGAVAPACFVDPLCAIELPPIEPATPRSLADDSAALGDPGAARRRADARTLSALAVWTASAPLALPMLSGACLLLSRRAIERAGGLFDARYPLYYEDTDLCRRLQSAGLRCVFEPRARVVHHWARSSGVGERFEREARARHDQSQRAYLERWFGAAAAAEVAASARAAEGREPPAIHSCVDLGEHERSVELRWSRAGQFVVELSMAPHFPLAAGVRATGPSWRAHPRTWEWLFEGRYFARAVDESSGAVAGAWTFVVRGSPRSRPLALEETADLCGDLCEVRA